MKRKGIATQLPRAADNALTSKPHITASSGSMSCQVARFLNQPMPAIDMHPMANAMSPNIIGWVSDLARGAPSIQTSFIEIAVATNVPATSPYQKYWSFMPAWRRYMYKGMASNRCRNLPVEPYCRLALRVAISVTRKNELSAK